MKGVKVIIMSKYTPLWEYVKENGNELLKLSFDEIKNISRVEIDHSFLGYKKELNEYGYEVKKISIKEQTVVIQKIMW